MRTLIVSNRLPVTLHAEHGDVRLVRSSGGLATALRSVHSDGESRWIGWPGDITRQPEPVRRKIAAELEAMRAVPVYITQGEIARYYDGFANGVLWPLCHYLLDKVRVDAQRDWLVYRQINERFADAVVAQYVPGDRIWIHDYQLALLPGLLRARLPSARIGFFLHIPFPAAEVFRILPWREEILKGLLGADVVGFQTASDAYHFTYSAAQLLGMEPTLDTVQYEERTVRVGAYPISIDTAEFEALARSEDVQVEAKRIRELARDKTIVLGVDRLDYTKGILRRIAAIERFLEREPSAREKLHFIQLAVPTRSRVESYAAYRREVNELVGRVNGQYGTGTSVPIHLLYRSVSSDELVALYSAADVMLVTPLRDGMNLVAKEYVACCVDGEGVLILSEFAGAATELRESLLVNPFDLDAVAYAVRQAVNMPVAEKRVRMAKLRDRVQRHDVKRWTQSFLKDLAGTGEVLSQAPIVDEVVEALAGFAEAPTTTFILDYDGTLVPFAPTPDLAMPDADLLALVRHLAALPRARVHIVTGRSRESVERWFEELPVGLHTEHGYWERTGPGAPWTCITEASLEWKEAVRLVLEDVTSRTDGSMIEDKTAGVAWHYRATEPQLAQTRLRELRTRLVELPEASQYELLEGSKVLEVRLHGVNKGAAVQSILTARHEAGAILCAGDDRTDEDMFAALPEDAVSIHVGLGRSRATYRVRSPAELRRVLWSLASSIG